MYILRLSSLALTGTDFLPIIVAAVPINTGATGNGVNNGIGEPIKMKRQPLSISIDQGLLIDESLSKDELPGELT